MIKAIMERMRKELSEMAWELNLALTASPFAEICAEAEFYSDLIDSRMNRDKLSSACTPRSCRVSEKMESGRAARIGIYPVSADPFHWGHLLIGLSAIARFTLDKVIYIIAGCDVRKPEMASPAVRHAMGRSILNMFTPLFEYSGAGLEHDLDGESIFFKILASHQPQGVNAFYIAGSDHCRRVDPKTGCADTIQKLEELVRAGASGVDRRNRRVSIIFVKRGETGCCSVKTQLGISYMPGVPFEASSTIVRRALAGKESTDRLALLPYTAYCYIRALGLYGGDGRPEQKKALLPVKRVA